MKHFTVIELGTDAESPMIGTINNVPNTPQGIQSFKERLLNAITEHFDSEVFYYDEIPNLFTGSICEDIMIEVEGFNYEIRILETWIF